MNKDFGNMDFAGLEQRIAAHEAKHGSMPFAPSNPLLDIHTITSAVVLNIPYSSVTKRQRGNVGKELNFSSLYTPGARWEVPQEAALMKIWTDKERADLVIHFGITDTSTLYQALVNHFNTNFGRK